MHALRAGGVATLEWLYEGGQAQAASTASLVPTHPLGK